MSEVKGRCPLPRAGLDSMFLVSVALVQSMAQPGDFIWRFRSTWWRRGHQLSQPSRWDRRELWGKTMQLSPPWIKNQTALQQREGVTPQNLWCAEHRESIPKRRWGSSSHEAVRSEAMWLNPKDVYSEKAQFTFWCVKFQFSWFSSWISHHLNLKYPRRS